MVMIEVIFVIADTFVLHEKKLINFVVHYACQQQPTSILHMTFSCRTDLPHDGALIQKYIVKSHAMQIYRRS